MTTAHYKSMKVVEFLIVMASESYVMFGLIPGILSLIHDEKVEVILSIEM